jgi:hypothetical protein
MAGPDGGDQDVGDQDFKDAKVGGYVGASLFGGFGLVFLVLLLVAIGGTIYDANQRGRVPVVAWIAVPALVVCTAVFGVLGRWSFRQLRLWKRLENRPILGWGTLGAHRPSGTKINTRRLHRFELTVTPPDGPSYGTEAKWFLPTDLEPVIAPGTVVAVRIDPEDARNVVIDWPRSRAAWAERSRASGTAPP